MNKTLIHQIKHYVGFQCKFPVTYDENRIPQSFDKGEIIGVCFDENLVKVKTPGDFASIFRDISPLEVNIEGKGMEDFDLMDLRSLVSSMSLPGEKYYMDKFELGQFYTMICDEPEHPNVIISKNFKINLVNKEKPFIPSAHNFNVSDVVFKLIDMGYYLSVPNKPV